MRKYIFGALTVVAIEFFFGPLGGRVFDYFFPPEHGFGGMMPDIPFYQWGYASILAFGIVLGIGIARWQTRQSARAVAPTFAQVPTGGEVAPSPDLLSAGIPTSADISIVAICFSSEMKDANWLTVDNIHNAYYLRDDYTSYDPNTNKTEITRRGFSLFVAIDRGVTDAHITVESTKPNARWAELSLTDRSAVLQFQGDYANEIIRVTFLAHQITGATRRLEPGIWRKAEPMTS